MSKEHFRRNAILKPSPVERLKESCFKPRSTSSRLTFFVLCFLFLLSAFKSMVQKSRKPEVYIFVSYVYFETELQSHCEVANKHTNLGFFLKSVLPDSHDNIFFRFTFPGIFPDKAKVIRAAGEHARSPMGLIINDVLSGSRQNFVMQHKERATGSTDLCVHHDVVRSLKENSYDYFLFLNDGVRGPFYDVDESKVRRWCVTKL